MVKAEEIAQVCGVKRGTVDRALHNRKGISPATKEKILKAAAEMGYRPNYMGRCLSKGITYTIGVVVLDLYNQFFGQLVNYIESEARKRGYYIQIALTHKQIENENAAIEHFIDRKVDGIILYSVQNKSDTFANVTKAGIPLVSIMNRINGDCGFIGINDRKEILKSVKCLMEAGHKKIGYISYPLNKTGEINQYGLVERYIGFKNAMEQCGLECDEKYIIIDSQMNEGFEKLLGYYNHDRENAPTAFVCFDDLYAIEAIRFFKNHNLKVPEDISIIGFDNIQASGLISPPLTTIEYPIELIANKALDYLIENIENKKSHDCENSHKPIDVTFPTKLIIRESVKKRV